jgi:AraC-like DNA-binding protein
MYIEKGSLTLEFEGHTRQIEAGSFVLIDCYKPHSYYSDQGWESIWCHFDGPTARAYYETIVSHLSNVFSLVNPYPIISKLESIYHTFLDGSVIKEPLMSKFINDILTAFLLYTPQGKNASNYLNMAQEIISYINEHFTEDISVDTLAERAGLSVYHFIRTFKKETGFTPHEYIINTRLNTAKYLLQNSKLPVKDICFNTGFSSESVFCSAFKKHLNVTPTQYRNLQE